MFILRYFLHRYGADSTDCTEFIFSLSFTSSSLTVIFGLAHKNNKCAAVMAIPKKRPTSTPKNTQTAKHDIHVNRSLLLSRQSWIGSLKSIRVTIAHIRIAARQLSGM